MRIQLIKLNILLFTSLLFFYSLNCKKDKRSELEKLPTITQNGANTFGCLINGKAYTPKGYRGNVPNYYVLVDPGFSDGDLSIRTYRIEDNLMISLSISSDSIKNTGIYTINDHGRTQSRFSKDAADLSRSYCDIFYGSTHQRNGFLKITRYDLQNGIIAGEFEISMVNRDCGYGDTIKITEGRFDYKL